MEQNKIKNQTILLLAFGLFSVSVASIFIKLCAAPALVIAAYRLTIASIFYLSFTRFKKGAILSAFNKSSFKMALISSLFLTLHFSTWISSLKFTSVASSVLLVQSTPIFVAIGSFIFLKEKPMLLTVIGAGIALAGSIIISLHDFSTEHTSLTGNLLAVGGAVGAAGYILAGRKLRATIDTLRYVTVVYSLTAVFLLLIALASRAPFFDYEVRTFVLLLAIAVFPQIIGHTSFNWALKYIDATTVSIVLLGEPIGASLLAFFLLGETLTWIKILGGMVILSGVMVVLIFERQPLKKATVKLERGRIDNTVFRKCVK